MIFLDIVREVVWLIWVVFLLRAEWTMSKNGTLSHGTCQP